ncbi:hypothetical protein DSOL_3008 [Desulfosporosinus metallidurans]|uniref:Uncharacterized protein n=1 Tax=Desulfosporosinus metallidurans TaxID=1888891 RepID=A0A1Q8QTK9_9FIRM|nr:hypothetical protein DSOL_3008 [Desulfosporosinus metallidurans]
MVTFQVVGIFLKIDVSKVNKGFSGVHPTGGSGEFQTRRTHYD